MRAEEINLNKKMNSSSKTRAMTQIVRSNTKQRKQNSKKVQSPKQITKNYTNKAMTGVSSDNRYAILSDNENEVEAPMPPVKIKTPPIVVINKSLNEIKTFMLGLNIINFNLKYISMGIKVLCTSLDDFNKTIHALKAEKCEYYTHDVPSQQLTKFVLFGLPELSIDEVKAGLQTANVVYSDVKKMRTKYDNKNKALYLVYFPAKSTKLSELKTVKYVLNVVVSWKPYIPSKNGPTQCNNCQLHGHGSKNCNLPPRCSKCGGKHETLNCSIDTNQSAYKCCLCGNDHSSRDKNCAKRINYIKMKLSNSTNKLKSNANQQSITKKAQQYPPQNSYESEFPSMKIRQDRKFSDWFAESEQSSNNNFANNKESLLTPQQLLDLTLELMTDLKNCRSKMDQFQVITKLALKYVNYD